MPNLSIQTAKSSKTSSKTSKTARKAKAAKAPKLDALALKRRQAAFKAWATIRANKAKRARKAA
ncbi:MAG TPA: hypothetical protein VH539_15040 [Gemmatimonadaceae bacterium]|jgi:hypothetical protein